MALNTSKQEIIDSRRQRVAQLRLRGLTQREIVDALVKSGLRNTETGEAYSLGTINADIQAIDEQWRREALGSTASLKARNWAELREVRRKAWQDSDLGMVLRALKQECELLGLDAPDQKEFSGPGGNPIQIQAAGVVVDATARPETGSLTERLQALLDNVTPERRDAIMQGYSMLLAAVQPLTNNLLITGTDNEPGVEGVDE